MKAGQRLRAAGPSQGVKASSENHSASAATHLGFFDLRGRFRRWFEARLPLCDITTLTQRNVFILPTRPGFMLGATLLVLLLASINYQLNLGYLLTFLLAGSALVGMHVCHGTLRGITMHLIALDAQFAGASAIIGINLQSNRRSVRYGIGLAVLGSGQWVWTDVPAQGMATVHVAFQPERRGLHRVPTLTAETRFPLGTFRVWTVWRPAAQVLVYPAPEAFPPPLPAGEPRAGGAAAVHQPSSGEYDGVRAYRRGDPLKLVVWKKAAKSDELVSRDAQQVQRYELWLDQHHTGTSHLEQQLSRLCAWVLQAEKLGLDYGLSLSGLEIQPGHGEAHKRRCLQALALQ
ncbi:MAG: DUF58 domain-containing protein [Rhodoferax sp.]|uniref:DUF58 domain-containing protein n=1 Tax=Rhodoferax sp. TaxID=50421 RepID=UPI0017940756|nr:DUF58 domain-containing protein [Rhodoferax sp.]NMM21126.1 DUF58 domain-containing protein [Rhodoferax sp.]